MRLAVLLLFVTGFAVSAVPADAPPAVPTVEVVEERAVLSEDTTPEASPPARPPATPARVLAVRATEPPPTPPPRR